jgi:hypothetical protein
LLRLYQEMTIFPLPEGATPCRFFDVGGAFLDVRRSSATATPPLTPLVLSEPAPPPPPP